MVARRSPDPPSQQRADLNAQAHLPPCTSQIRCFALAIRAQRAFVCPVLGSAMIRPKGRSHYQKWLRDPLYDRSGSPQSVQGKLGENHGESVYSRKRCCLSVLHRKSAERAGTRRLVWGLKCDFCTIDFYATQGV